METRIWHWDARPNPWQKGGKPQWKPYDENTSAIIETHFQLFCQMKTKEEQVKLLKPKGYVVDVKSCVQMSIQDRYKQRPVMRGKPNQIFGGNPIKKGKWEPYTIVGNQISGCDWLGVEFYKSIDQKPFTIQTVLQGFLDENALWNYHIQTVQLSKNAKKKRQQETWRQIFDFNKITDNDIKEIIMNKHSQKSDRARGVILKIYTYETDLYQLLNTTNCTHDKSKIPTLGPYSYLLLKSIESPPLQNIKVISNQLFKGKDTMKVYRGLALPKQAISSYKQMWETGTKFSFNGFTSTDARKEVAIKFAKLGIKGGKVPVILEFVLNDTGCQKAFLSSAELSAFANEKEVLLGLIVWSVEKISQENGLTIIQLREQIQKLQIDKKEVKPNKIIKYGNRDWFYDARPNPWEKGLPQWTPYDDITSIMIEKHFQEYSSGMTKEETLILNDSYKINIKVCRQVKISEFYCQRPIKRGTQPIQKLGDNDNVILKGKYEPITIVGNQKSGCDWLGVEFHKSIDKKPFTIQTVFQGLLHEQTIWNSNTQQNVQLSRDANLQRQQEGWRCLFNLHNITDLSINEIILNKHSQKSDRARGAILKMYTYETPLYRLLNTANCTHDRSKILTLGPISYLLLKSLESPPLENIQDIRKLFNGKTMTVYRGTALTKKAMTVYTQMLLNEDTFYFNGFTTTSVDKNLAIRFAKRANQNDGKAPVIFELVVKDPSCNKAYLNTAKFSAFPNEKEVLIGFATWTVIKVSKENGLFVIQLSEQE